MAHKEYVRHTDGSKAVLLIHGFLGSPEHFNEFIKCIPEDYGVYNVLLEGHGKSVKDFAKASMNGWKKQIEKTAAELTSKYSQIYIIGHSMGTLFAMDTAVKYEDKVKAVMLMQTPLKIGLRGSACVNTFKSFFNIFSENDKTGTANRNAHSVALNKRFWEYAGWVPRYLELFEECKQGRETVLKLKAPCFIFQSKNDELVSIKSVGFIPKKSNIKTKILQNSAHFIYSKEDFEIMKKQFEEMINSD